MGFLFARDRPDLIKRICSIDIGGRSNKDAVTTIFTLSYQLFFCLLFAVGDPVSTFMLKTLMYFIPHKFFGAPARPYNEITSSMMYPYWQLFFKHLFNSSETYFGDLAKGKAPFHKVNGDKCPIFFAYGANKPIMFHSDKWLKDIKDNSEKGCLAKGYNTMHWVMHEKPDEFNEDLL